jgi:alkanesulfonate monooxygenase SsuD/methylene tetrahydromethanopterin reductase-like flavin-dependent oxidoreductase (luciferase family)
MIAKEGRNPRDVKRTMMKAIICGRTDAEYEARLRGPRRNPANEGVSTKEMLDRVRERWIVGTPQEVAAQIKAFGEAGVQEIMAQFLVTDDFDGIRVLGEQVLPLLR